MQRKKSDGVDTLGTSDAPEVTKDLVCPVGSFIRGIKWGS